MEIRSAYSDGPRKADEKRPYSIDLSGDTRAKQSFKDECDINVIMKKYEATGLIDHVNTHQGHYADVLEVPDYQSALNSVMSAQNAFMSLPAAIRAQFENDPGQFLAFVQNPANRDEMIEMGLAEGEDTRELIGSPDPDPEVDPQPPEGGS